MFKTLSHQENANQTTNEILSHPSWNGYHQKKKKKKKSNAGEDAGNKEPVSGNVNLCGHYGNQ
jgi:hypothetical protein